MERWAHVLLSGGTWGGGGAGRQGQAGQGRQASRQQAGRQGMTGRGVGPVLKGVGAGERKNVLYADFDHYSYVLPRWARWPGLGQVRTSAPIVFE